MFRMSSDLWYQVRFEAQGVVGSTIRFLKRKACRLGGYASIRLCSYALMDSLRQIWFSFIFDRGKHHNRGDCIQQLSITESEVLRESERRESRRGAGTDKSDMLYTGTWYHSFRECKGRLAIT